MDVLEKMPVLEKKAMPKIAHTIPNYLVWEVLDGELLYRRGYKDVLRKLKTVEEIMGTSSYQSLISDYIVKLLHRQLNDEVYDVLASEIGAHLTHKNNLSIDIAIYPLLSADKITRKYTNYPAKIAIEVDIDIDIDPSVMKDMVYVDKKTKKLLNFGVEKIHAHNIGRQRRDAKLIRSVRHAFEEEKSVIFASRGFYDTAIFVDQFDINAIE